MLKKTYILLQNYWKSITIISCILYLSFAPSSTFNGIPSFENEDKLVHILMYFGLAAILFFDFSMATKSTNIKKLDFVLICIIFPALFGGVVEIIQPLLHEPRTASWIDWMADLIGVITGFGCMKLIFNKLQK